ncbi:gamma-glutamyltransferase [Caulobacter segnis]
MATGFAPAVTYPEAGNLGGGGFMTLYVDGKPHFLDQPRPTAPAAATADMHLGKGGATGRGPVAVRQSRGRHARHGARLWATAHESGSASCPWARVLAPAIRYARDGFRVNAQFSWDAEPRGSAPVRPDQLPRPLRTGAAGDDLQAAATGRHARAHRQGRRRQGILRGADRRPAGRPDAARAGQGPDHQGRPGQLQGCVARAVDRRHGAAMT